jgi:oligopeptidase B
MNKNDKYDWLRDKNWPNVTNPRVLEYLHKENEFFKNSMQDMKPLEKQLYQELKARIKEDDESYPVKKDQYYYFTKMQKGQDYPILYRKKDYEELILDSNELAEGKSSFSMGITTVSNDHSKFAYAYDDDGSERFTIYTKDLQTGNHLTTKISDSIGNIVWNSNSDGFYYVKLNKNWRPDQVFFHRLNSKVEDDILIYQELDPGLYIDIDYSSSKKYLFINSGNGSSNEIKYLDLTSSNYNLKTAIKLKKNHLYTLDHLNDRFYLSTNDKGKNFRLVSVKEVDNFAIDKFEEIIAHHQEHYLVDFSLYQEYIVVSKQILGLNNIEYYNLANFKLAGAIKFDEEVYAASVQFTNKEDPYLRINYSSLTKPKSILEYEFSSKTLYTRKTEEIASGYDANLYQAKRLWVESLDGTKVPISMVYRKDLLLSPNKLLLYGYGSYGYGMPTSFRSNVISLLDRGFIYVIAHIRGGDELGFNWYESAKFLTKKKTFEDFIAVAEYLIKENYTTNEKLAIMGGSAGGMLMGVVVNQRPDLFKSVIALVPFVDVLNTMLDDSLPLTPLEYEEWGNPKEEEYYQYIKSYSPYDNVKKQDYPHMLVTAGLTDPRVGYWEAAKWVEKLREYRQNDNLLLLKTEMEAGHKGQSGRFKGLEEIAMIYSFLIKSLG